MKKMKKTTKSNLVTYGLVIGIYLVTQILIMTGSISSLLQGLLVPLCSYVILAVSLNLTVGILGELSLGHAGFMCVGAFTSAFFSKCMVAVSYTHLSDRDVDKKQYLKSCVSFAFDYRQDRK